MTDSTHTNFAVRRATQADVDTIARHRASMFRDMGRTNDATFEPLVEAARAYLAHAIPSGAYVAFMAHVDGEPDHIVGGAGALVRSVPPFPITANDGIVSVAEGRQALIQNVFTERAWRRRGVAALLMKHAIEWATEAKIESLVLHASVEGRPLYEQLGFKQTNEMSYQEPTGR